MPRTCAPYRYPWQMPAHRWAARFLFSFCWSITRLYAKRIGVFLKSSPPEKHRFDVFGGTSIYEIILVDFAEAMEHVAYEKRFQMNSRLRDGQHAIMLDWDRITQAQLEEWIRAEGRRWHVYKTEQGFHFICSTRTVSYWQLLGLLYRRAFFRQLQLEHERGAMGALFYGKNRNFRVAMMTKMWWPFRLWDACAENLFPLDRLTAEIIAKQDENARPASLQQSLLLFHAEVGAGRRELRRW